MVHESRVIDHVGSKFDEAFFELINKTSRGNDTLLSRIKTRSYP